MPWMWQKNPRAQERARAKRKGSYPTKKQQEFSTTPIYHTPGRLLLLSIGEKEQDLFNHDIYIFKNMFHFPRPSQE